MTHSLLDEVKDDVLPDQSKAVEYENTIPPAGKTLARFIGYVEVGKRKDMYEGKEKGTVLRAKLFFELLGKAHMKDVDGKQQGTLFTQDVAVKTGEKAGFRKLFMKMRAGDESITHMAKLLNRGFIIEITHTNGKGDKADVTYANMTRDGEWLIYPPIFENPATGEVTKLPVPDATIPMRLLLWSNPSKAQWDSIFIDGTYTRKNKDGTEEEVSKNWLQNLIVRDALDFEGSPLQDLLIGLGALTLDASEGKPDPALVAAAEKEAEAIAAAAQASKAAPVADKPTEAAPVKEAAPAAAPAEPAKAADPAPAQVASADDLFAQLGINP
jgi:hypothetical protein